MGNHADPNGDPPTTESLGRQRRSVLFAAVGACVLGLVMIRHAGSPPPLPPQTRAVVAASPSASATPCSAPPSVSSPTRTPSG